MTSETDKKQGVPAMFDGIAHSYDRLNHLFTAGIDIYWRNRLIKRATQMNQIDTIADIATGTGDLALALNRAITPNRLIGIDLSEEMLAIARKKEIKRDSHPSVKWIIGNGEAIDLPDTSCDLVTTAFGIRNFQHPDKGLSEFYRILKPGGRLLVLELSIPTNPLFRPLYFFYFRHLLPAVGKLLSGHASAYAYLPASVLRFPCGERFVDMMRKTGFSDASHTSYTFGIATLYEATKP